MSVHVFVYGSFNWSCQFAFFPTFSNFCLNPKTEFSVQQSSNLPSTAVQNVVAKSSRDFSLSEQSFQSGIVVQDVENVVAQPCCIHCQDKYDIIINALSEINSKVDSLCEISKKS